LSSPSNDIAIVLLVPGLADDQGALLQSQGKTAPKRGFFYLCEAAKKPARAGFLWHAGD
jgi:hypothetical protein